tara:strand:- start:63 stop:182 length:120 start_codon:yes stop_codon:yes gene_type:complete
MDAWTEVDILSDRDPRAAVTRAERVDVKHVDVKVDGGTI